MELYSDSKCWMKSVSYFRTVPKELAKQLIERSPDTNRVIKNVYHDICGLNVRRILAKETWNQLKILTSKNQRIAVKRVLGDDQIQYKL